jgi:UDP-N-acetylglucosamine:LPS N-acetylglucosamine transferase
MPLLSMTLVRPRLHANVTPSPPRPAILAPMIRARRIVVYLLDAGGGHRATANALRDAAAERGLEIEAVSLRTVFADIDYTRRFGGIALEEMYNDLVRRGWTLGLVPLLRALQWTIRRIHKPLVRRIARDLAARKPDAVLSVLPNFNAPMRDAVRTAVPGVPFAVLMTDLFDFPPHFWLEPGLDRLLTGTPDAARAAEQAGLSGDRITTLSGMVLHPRFYPAPGPDTRRRVRQELGIAAERFTFLLLYGGKGAPEMRPLVQALLLGCPDASVIAVCGDNSRLLARVEALVGAAPGRLHAMGFTKRVAELMAASDVVVTKPGPGSLAEALHLRLPAIVTENGFTVPQERANARWIEREGMGFVVHRWQDIPALAAGLMATPSRLEAVRTRLQSLPENRGLYEALDVLEALVRAQPTGHEAVRPPLAELPLTASR